MVDSPMLYLAILIVSLFAGYSMTDLVFRWLFGIRIVINDKNGRPVKYRLKKGHLRRLK